MNCWWLGDLRKGGGHEMDESVCRARMGVFSKAIIRVQSSVVMARTLHSRTLRLDRVVPFTGLAPQGRLIYTNRPTVIVECVRGIIGECALLLTCIKQNFIKDRRAMVVQASRRERPQDCVDDLLLGYSELRVVSLWMLQADISFANDIEPARTHPAKSSKAEL